MSAAPTNHFVFTYPLSNHLKGDRALPLPPSFGTWTLLLDFDRNYYSKPEFGLR